MSSSLQRLYDDSGALEGDAHESVSDASLNALLVSDTHLESGMPDGGRKYLRDTVVRKNLEDIAEEYGCNTLIHGGDLGGVKDAEAFLDYDFERSAFAVGDGDKEKDENSAPGWYRGTKKGARRRLFDDDENRFGRRVVVDDFAETPYDIEIAHQPGSFGVRSHTTQEDYDGYEDVSQHLDRPMIAIYGDKHQPFTRTLRNSLVIGLGSTYQNYDITEKMPEKSAHVLQIDGADVSVQHLDYDTGEVFEHQEFRFEDGRFIEQTEWDVLSPEERFINA